MRFVLTLSAAAGLALAQSQTGGWRRVGDPPPPQPQANRQAPAPQSPQQGDPEPVDRSDAYGQPVQNQPIQNQQDAPPYPQQQAPLPPYQQQQGPSFDQQQPPPPSAYDPNRPPQASSRPSYGLPASVTVQPGTYVTVRINQPLSSDHNQAGDTFSATFAQPLVVNGVVVAQRGQTLYGRVAEAEKSHSDRPSRLGLELTSMTLADGTQVQVRSQLVARQGGTTPAGQQVGTVAGTTIAGAAIGGIADYGRGAAIGAGVGAAAGIIGVMLTRNRPTEVYPETALTFRMESPVTVDLARAPQAFRYVAPNEYDHNPQLQPRPRPQTVYGPPVGGYYYYGPGYYPYPYYYGGFGVVIGGRGYYGRGYFRRW